jgi:hypothetical protein
VGAFSPPLRLTGRLLDLWASQVEEGDDEIADEPVAGAVIPLHTETSDAPVAPAKTTAEETLLPRAAGRDAR